MMVGSATVIPIAVVNRTGPDTSISTMRALSTPFASTSGYSVTTPDRICNQSNFINTGSMTGKCDSKRISYLLEA